MINPDTLYRRSNNSLILVANVLKNRIEEENLDKEIKALFIINLDLIQGEINKRGLNEVN